MIFDTKKLIRSILGRFLFVLKGTRKRPVVVVDSQMLLEAMRQGRSADEKRKKAENSKS
jgi:hypothetical protein